MSEQETNADPDEVASKPTTRAEEIALPLVVIVGRPNVGKSTLFNRMVGERRSITGDEPGITRDRIYGVCDWAYRRFEIVDTGGIVPDDEAIIPANILRQAETAIRNASALLWVVDVRAGITPLDEELARLLRSTGKPVFVAANKADAVRLEAEAAEFHRFGFADVFPIAAEHGTGVAEMLDAIVETFPPEESAAAAAEFAEYAADETTDDAAQDAAPREIRVAIIGRPNVGKSSLLNKLLGEERAIVSPIAGTTRDAVDTLFEYEDQRFRLIDTAGIRRKGKTTEMTEKLAVMMARRNLDRADVAIVMVDATEGGVALDAHIAGYAVESGCSVILAVNKWDAIENKLTGTPFEFERNLRDGMKFLDYAPVVTISALSGQRVVNLLPLIIRANEARNRRIPTGELNRFFERAVENPRAPTAPAPVKGGRSRLHVQYATQAGIRPPTFIVFTSGGAKGIHFSYERYLQNRLREEFDFFATPLRIVERHKTKK